MPRKLDLGDTPSSGSVNVVYVHGVSRQARADTLRMRWDTALFGRSLGTQSRFAYWSDLRFWDDNPVDLDDDGVGIRRADKSRAKGLLDFFARLGSRFVEDANQYLTNQEFRDRVRRRLADCLVDPDRDYLVVAHSLGSVIAYHELSTGPYGDRKGKIKLLTIGTPLAADVFADKMREFLGLAGDAELNAPKCVSVWVDVVHPSDPVARGGSAAKQIRGVTETRLAGNFDEIWFSSHYAINYLKHPEVRSTARTMAPGAGALLASSPVSLDLHRAFEIDIGTRQPVLLEFADDDRSLSAAEASKATIKLLGEILEDNVEAAKIDPLARFVSASLTKTEVDLLLARGRAAKLAVSRIWRNSQKRANHVQRGTVQATPAAVLQVKPARLGYEADGRGIGWAVLDTGIRADHPHFSKRKGSVGAVYDCTALGRPIRGNGLGTGPGSDRNGHGTHVAAVIAGGDPGSDIEISMAPKTTIHSYKVLRDDGSGDDASIIKALDHIAATNAKASRPIIHGVNLSLGGPFDSEVYGTGHSPLCRELRRLAQSGVVVCVSAGNEGAMEVLVPGDEPGDAAYPLELQFDVSIGDPANLEDAIAVGSVHSTMPERFGVSYFSSRGPTADGRAKPDVVAPGEKIWSANARFEEAGEDDYVRMSGSSMACPHVSGLIAAFLSVRRGYIGYPERVKEVLMANCLDLKRDRYFQGAGLPNLVKMLLATA